LGWNANHDNIPPKAKRPAYRKNWDVGGKEDPSETTLPPRDPHKGLDHRWDPFGKTNPKIKKALAYTLTAAASILPFSSPQVRREVNHEVKRRIHKTSANIKHEWQPLKSEEESKEEGKILNKRMEAQHIPADGNEVRNPFDLSQKVIRY